MTTPKLLQMRKSTSIVRQHLIGWMTHRLMHLMQLLCRHITICLSDSRYSFITVVWPCQVYIIMKKYMILIYTYMYNTIFTSFNLQEKDIFQEEIPQSSSSTTEPLKHSQSLSSEWLYDCICHCIIVFHRKKTETLWNLSQLFDSRMQIVQVLLR